MEKNRLLVNSRIAFTDVGRRCRATKQSKAFSFRFDGWALTLHGFARWERTENVESWSNLMPTPPKWQHFFHHLTLLSDVCCVKIPLNINSHTQL